MFGEKSNEFCQDNKLVGNNMKTKHLILLLLALGLSPIASRSQNTSTQGKEFWLTFMQNGFKEHPDGGWIENQVLISAKRNCTGTVSNPLTGWSQSFSVSANNITTIEIPERQGYHDVGDAEMLSDRAIHVLASDTVSVYCTNIAHVSFDASFVLPVESLGDDYIIQCFDQSVAGSINNFVSNNESSAFAIIAIEDNTEVSITPTVDLISGYHTAGMPFTISMDAGQTYHVRSTLTGSHRDLSGTRVTAAGGKRIAVFNGNTLTCIPIDIGNGYDHVVEQAMPLRSWGKQFVVTSSSNRNRDFIKITSAVDNNVITKNGNPLVTLQAYDSYTFIMEETQRSCFLSATQPCAVYLYDNSSYDQNPNGGTLGDPSMVWIAPVEQRIDEVTFSTFNNPDINIMVHCVNIIVNTIDTDKVYLDGQLLSPDVFTPANGNPNYSYVRRDISHGVHHIACINGFNAHVYGFGTAKSYAYLVGSKTNDLTSHLIVNNESAAFHPNGYDICVEDTPVFDLGLNFDCSLAEWDFGDGQTGTGFPVSHTYPTAGSYTVSCDVYTIAHGQNTFVATLYTTIHVHPIQHGMDTKTVCGAYMMNGQLFAESGIYEYQLEDRYGCDSIVSLNLTITHEDLFPMQGREWVAASTDIIVGPYHYWVEDSLLFAPNALHWSCSNPEWRLTPIGNGYRAHLFPDNIGEGTITARTDDVDCDTVYSINVRATWYDVPENQLVNITMYPNPTTNHVIIESNGIVHVRLIDMLGQTIIVKEYNLADFVDLDITHMPAGVYMVEITTRLGKTIKRLVIAK